MAIVWAPSVEPMFRNRERMTRFLVIFVTVMVVLSLVIPFIQALRG